MGIINLIINKYKKHINPVNYWRKKGASIGERCEIYPSASFGSEPYLITIGNHVRINSGVMFFTHDGGVWVLRDLKEELNDIDLFGRISVGDNVHIGTNAIILPGVHIGNNCIIGCGAIVTRDIPDNSVAVGVPAKVIENIDQYLIKNMNLFQHTKDLSSKDKKSIILTTNLKGK
ncbi:MAG: acyltransferase [Bacilli bacterium]